MAYYPVTEIKYGDSFSIDAFGRARVSNPVTLFERSFQYGIDYIYFTDYLVSGSTITFDQNKKSAILNVSANSGSRAVLQSRQYLVYEKGRSQLSKLTFVLGSASDGIIRRVGYFDDDNGVFLQQSGSSVGVVLRSKTTGTVVDTYVSQSQWNVDTLDGSGSSGEVLDLTKQQIFAIDAQFLGTGRVRTAFNIDGKSYVAHQFLNANVNETAPYMQTFNLPLRYELDNISNNTGTLQCICCEVESEGGSQSPQYTTFTTSSTAAVSVTSTRTAMISIRPTGSIAGSPNRTTVIPESFTILTGNVSVKAELLWNSVLTGTWNQVSPSSSVEAAINPTINTPGIPVDSFYVPNGTAQSRVVVGNRLSTNYPLTLDVTGSNPTNFTLALTSTGADSSCLVTLTWKEIY